MKRIWVIAAFLMTGSVLALQPLTLQFGQVTVVQPGTPGDPLVTININSWQHGALLTDIDSALARARRAEILILTVPECVDGDSQRVKEVAGRFTPFDLEGIETSGRWQWDRPLIVRLADSAHCPIFLGLRERRWTEIIFAGDEQANAKINSAYSELLRRYKRERVDRMEEMFGR